MRVDLDVEDEGLHRRLEAMHGGALDATPVWGRIADDFLQIERAVFASAGMRAGAHWLGDSAAWVERKVRMGRSPLPLIFTGALRDSLTKRGAKWSVRRTSNPKEMTVGTRDPIVNIVATDNRRGKTSRSGLIGVQQQDRRRWAGWAAGHIMATDGHTGGGALGTLGL